MIRAEFCMLTEFLKARDLLLANRTDYETAYRLFRWPQLDQFNWALDYFDVIAAGNRRTALWIVDEEDEDVSGEVRLSFSDLSAASSRTANYFRRIGVQRGDRLLLMLGNEAALWEAMLAACKLGAVVIPAASLLGSADLRDRLDRGKVRHVIAGAAQTENFERIGGGFTRICVGGPVAGWRRLEEARMEPSVFLPEGITRAQDPLLLYFTSGTTAQPKLVEHSQELVAK